MKLSTAEIENAIVHVQQDLKDDFWPDIVAYEDLFSGSGLVSKLKSGHTVKTINSFDIPKPTLVLRPGHFITLPDRVYYQVLVNRFAKKVDKKMVSRDISFSHRTGTGTKFLINFFKGWEAYNDKQNMLFKKNPTGLMLCTDLTAFFEHIQIKILIKTLRSLNVDKEICDALSHTLNTWTVNEIGIPQGNDTSSFLANVYLDEIDKGMLEAGFKYFRYMDDIRVYCKTEDECHDALIKITQLLRDRNLHLSGGKTKILDKSSYYEETQVNERLMQAINYNVHIYGLLRKKVTLRNLKKIWKEQVIQNFNKTTFRFCVNRFRDLQTDFPLQSILNHDFFGASNIDVVSKYLIQFISRKKVQEKLISKFLRTPYLYEKIIILKTLLHLDKEKFLKKKYFNVSSFNKSLIYGSNNFLLIGYFFVFSSTLP